MTPVQIGGIIACVLFLLFLAAIALAVFVWIPRRMNRKKVNTAARFDSAEIKQGCKCGSSCQCLPPPRDACEAATRCAPPIATPKVIDGLSCDPHDQTHLYAGDVQHLVHALNSKKSEARRSSVLASFANDLNEIAGYEVTE